MGNTGIHGEAQVQLLPFALAPSFTRNISPIHLKAGHMMVKPLVALCLVAAAGCAFCEPITFRLAQKQALVEHKRLRSWQGMKGLR